MEGNRKPGSRALRRGRVSEPGRIYLVTAVTRDRTPHFRDLHCARAVVSAMQAFRHAAGTLCFVVMPDHWHWLFQLREGARLEEVVSRAKRRAARECNRRLGRTGRFWQDGFHDRALRREEDLVAVARYVVANPLRAGLVRRLADYPHWDAVWVGDRGEAFL